MTTGMSIQKAYRAKNQNGQPKSADVYVGSRIRLRRILMGMTQQELANSIKMSFQQVQKYESGKNRVSSSTLIILSTALSIPVSFFFDGYGEEEIPQGSRSDDLEIVRLNKYYRLAPRAVREAILELLETTTKETI